MSRPTDAPRRDRYWQCDETCTVDCGACKGAGRPAPDDEDRAAPPRSVGGS